MVILRWIGKRWWLIPLSMFLLFGALTVLYAAFPIPEVAIKNDMSIAVVLKGCYEPFPRAESGETTTARPNVACQVYFRESNYIGCLRFPDEAFGPGVEVALSSLDRKLTARECASIDSYAHKSGYGRFWADFGFWN